MKKIISILLILSLLFVGLALAENYKLTAEGVQRLSDGAFIPATMINADWRNYQEWLSEGNMPLPQFTAEELAAKKTRDIKMKEAEIIQVRIQKDAAQAEGLSIAADYEAQLIKLRKELNDLKK